MGQLHPYRTCCGVRSKPRNLVGGKQRRKLSVHFNYRVDHYDNHLILRIYFLFPVTHFSTQNVFFCRRTIKCNLNTNQQILRECFKIITFCRLVSCQFHLGPRVFYRSVNWLCPSRCLGLPKANLVSVYVSLNQSLKFEVKYLYHQR